MLLGSVAGAGMTDYSYAITPFLAWLIAGCSKFLINSIRARKLAFDLIGYGGLPSNHSAIVSSVVALIAFKESIEHPAFGVAVALAFIVMLDANSLRRQVGRQAETLNILAAGCSEHQVLRERMGHTRLEIVAGIVVGVAVALAVHWLTAAVT